MNQKIQKIVGINLLILLVYTILIHAFNITNHHDKVLEIAFSLMFAIGLHTLINFALSIGYFITKKNDLGKAFLLSTAVVLVIGFSGCYGSIFLS